MDAIPDLQAHLTALLRDAVAQVLPGATAEPLLERPKQVEHGDYTSNIALQLAKAARKSPREVAAALLAGLGPSPYLDRAEIAGPGFINFHFRPEVRRRAPGWVLGAGECYGNRPAGERGRVLVEFVSANPTGPLHVGHGRGAAYGASLANLLAAAGWRVEREYYVNDAGRQMDTLALSTWLRYLEAAGTDIPFPANGYQGDYVKAMGAQIWAAHGRRYLRPAEAVTAGAPAAEDDPEAHLDALIANAKKLLGEDYAYVHDFALTEQLGDGRNDLLEFGVNFDTWFSERSLFDSGAVARVVAQLDGAGHLYRQDGALWFRATDFGDEKDRVVRRENGQFTYFASDIAYHFNKFQRGFDRLVNVWGADHHGYAPRLKGAMGALEQDPERLTVVLVQFAVLYRAGKKISMSTRGGQFVTLRELREEVGNDAARFFYVLRNSDQHLDFDLDLAKSRSNENPVYYVQYAHARICSVLAQWGKDPAALVNADPAPLEEAQEMLLLRRLMEYPEIVEIAARELAPHIVAFYLKDLAGIFHSYYNATHFLAPDPALKLARLALVAATGQVLRNGLGLLGVTAPEKM